MALDHDEETFSENIEEFINNLSNDLMDLYSFRDLFFENHPVSMASEKDKLVENKREELIEKFESIDVDKHIPKELLAKFLYLKGKCYNVSIKYDPRSSQCLSKAIKLNPHLVEAWNELGECYWKNMNIKEAEASFEGALKQRPNKLSLRCLSIILRQEREGKKSNEAKSAILKSVELAKQAVALDTKDGLSWTVLGNAYLCQFFVVSQKPTTLKSCMSAYRQAWLDPVARGQPDLYYNKAIALKYEELYEEAIKDLEHACAIEPSWTPPKTELSKLTQYLVATTHLVQTRGKIKPKRLKQMIQSLDNKMLGDYSVGSFHNGNVLALTSLDKLREGGNPEAVVLGRVVGSIYNENAVPFTFALVDSSMEGARVTVYNWAGGRGVIVGDAVAIPAPAFRSHDHQEPSLNYKFKSIRVDDPTLLVVNGKRIGKDQFAGAQVTSTYEVH